MSSAFSTISPSVGPSMWSHEGNEEQSTWGPVSRSEQWNAMRPRDTVASSVYGESQDGHDSVGGAGRMARVNSVPRVVNGAQIMSRPVPPTVEVPRSGSVPTVKLVDVAVKRPEQAVVQSDLSWVNLEAKA